MDLPNDIKQLIFSCCDWKQYYELCIEYGMPLRLKLLNDLPSIEYICNEKIEYFEIVKYLHKIHENGAPIAKNAINWASSNEHFEIVKYLHVHGAPITENAINLASENGHFEIVKYLHENGAHKCAPITEYTIYLASNNKHFDIVNYLRSAK